MYLSQVTYCGGYSGDEPPLPIPNREVKLTSADGTAPPGGRVGRCRFSEPRLTMSAGVLSLYCRWSSTESSRKPSAPYRSFNPLGPPGQGEDMPRKRGPRAAFRSAPAPLKSLAVFAAANTRDRVGRLMPTSLRSTCLVSATSRISGGAEGHFRPRQLDFCFAKGAEGLFCPLQPGFCFAGGAEGFLRPWQLDFCAARGKWLLFCPWQKKTSEAEGLFSELGSAAGRGGSGEGSAAAGSVGNGSGSRGSGKRGWKPSRTLPDRQTGKTAETKLTGKRDTRRKPNRVLPIGKRERQRKPNKTLPTGKRDNAAETKQNPPGRHARWGRSAMTIFTTVPFKLTNTE